MKDLMDFNSMHIIFAIIALKIRMYFVNLNKVKIN